MYLSISASRVKNTGLREGSTQQKQDLLWGLERSWPGVSTQVTGSGQWPWNRVSGEWGREDRSSQFWGARCGPPNLSILRSGREKVGRGSWLPPPLRLLSQKELTAASEERKRRGSQIPGQARGLYLSSLMFPTGTKADKCPESWPITAGGRGVRGRRRGVRQEECWAPAGGHSQLQTRGIQGCFELTLATLLWGGLTVSI